jgi:hypothetical protein
LIEMLQYIKNVQPQMAGNSTFSHRPPLTSPPNQSLCSRLKENFAGQPDVLQEMMEAPLLP